MLSFYVLLLLSDRAPNFKPTPYSMNSLVGELFKDFWPYLFAMCLTRFVVGILARFLFRVLARAFGSQNTVCASTGTEKCSAQFYWGAKEKRITPHYSKSKNSQTLS